MLPSQVSDQVSLLAADIALGDEWEAATVAAINQCRVMLLIFSSSANNSKQISRAVRLAFDKGVPVLPMRIENVVPSGALTYSMEARNRFMERSALPCPATCRGRR